MMICAYSSSVWFTLLSMVFLGAARSVMVKLAYQSGFQAPLTITILYLLGQSLSLVVYWFRKRFSRPSREENNDNDSASNMQQQDGGEDPLEDNNTSFRVILSLQELDGKTAIDDAIIGGKGKQNKGAMSLEERLDDMDGSNHGLSVKSVKATLWTERIPWYWKPLIPGICNLLNSTLRWLSLIFIAASVSEMLTAGIELVMSVFAARIIRKREVSCMRWIGVLLVAVGVVGVGFADYYNSKKESNNDDDDTEQIGKGQKDFVTGIILLLFQCVFSCLQDISEEIFMQVDEFPPTLLLGMEGGFGLVYGLVLFFTFGKELGAEDPSNTVALLRDNPMLIGWIIGLPFLFLVTGICNVKVTEATSSMTRNVWKNFRTLFVWIFSLSIFYASGNSEIGEAWLNPGSCFTLIGFFVMTVGVVAYYWFKNAEKSRYLSVSTGEEDAAPPSAGGGGPNNQTETELQLFNDYIRTIIE